MGPSGLGPESDRSSLKAGPPSVRGVREGICARYPLLASPPLHSTLLQPALGPGSGLT